MGKRKKNLYVVTKSMWGGAQKYVYDLAINLPREKFEAAVASGGYGPLLDKLEKAGIRTIRIPGMERDINFFKEIISLWHLFKTFLREKPDIVHLNSSKAGGLGAIAAKLSSLVIGHSSLVVFTVHGWAFNEERPSLQKIIIKSLSWLTAIFCDKIILINTSDFEIAKRFIPRKKLTLIFNGLETPDFIPRETARQSLSEKIGKPLGNVVLGTVAELTSNKGLENFLSALPRLNLDSNYRGLASIVIGDGEDYNLLATKIKSLGLEGKVFLAGSLPDAAKYLKAFDIFVLPSLKEGLPYTIMEAMAAGLPVVSTAVGGIPDLVVNNYTGLLVPPGKNEDLARALAALINDPRKRNHFGKKAEKKIKEFFGIKKMLEKTTELYSQKW